MSSVTPSSEQIGGIGGSFIGNELAMQFASETVAKSSSKFVDRKRPLIQSGLRFSSRKMSFSLRFFAVLRFAGLGRRNELVVFL